MAKFLIIHSEWSGGNTQQKPASVFATATGNSRFDTGYGTGYVVRPGGGTTGNDAERIESMTLTDTKFEVKWHATGGQNYTITLKFQNDNDTSYQAGSTGDRGHVPNAIRDNETDHI